MKKITAADREWAETVADQSLDDNEVETLVHEFNDWLDHHTNTAPPRNRFSQVEFTIDFDSWQKTAIMNFKE